MSQNPIHVEVRGKQIVKDPISKLIVQGEFEGETIVFTLDRYVGGNDLLADGLTYEIGGVNSNQQLAVNLLKKGNSPDPSKFTLTWVVGQQFTAANYEMRIWITAVKSVNDKVVFRWATQPARIYIHEGFVLSDYVSVTEQLLLDLGKYLAQSQAAAVASEESAQRSKTSELNAKNSETIASQSASSAKASETAAATSASSAASSQSAAKTSETNAKNSETAAANSASSAASSQNAAKDSEAKAKASETAAADSAVAAASSQSAAKASEEQARRYADQAGESADAAKVSADRAERAEAGALESAERAGKRADEATISAAEARESAKLAEALAVGDFIEVLRNIPFLWDPVTGKEATIQAVVYSLYSLHRDALTALEYDALDLTANRYDGFGLTAVMYDLDSRKHLANLYDNTLTAQEYGLLNLTATEYDVLGLTALIYEAEGKSIFSTK